MRTSKVLALLACLVFQSVCLFADGTVSPPNPIGERAYHARLLAHFLPAAIIAGTGLLACLIYAVRRKAKMPDTEPRHG